MEELNKKLAEWAGLDIRHKFVPIGFDNMVECSKCGCGKPSIFHYCNLPDFTHSLDACFKWLVPKSPEYNPDVRLIQHIDFDYGECHILDINGEEYIGEAETPALALCKAIEKLIDGEK